MYVYIYMYTDTYTHTLDTFPPPSHLRYLKMEAARPSETSEQTYHHAQCKNPRTTIRAKFAVKPLKVILTTVKFVCIRTSKCFDIGFFIPSVPLTANLCPRSCSMSRSESLISPLGKLLQFLLCSNFNSYASWNIYIAMHLSRNSNLCLFQNHDPVLRGDNGVCCVQIRTLPDLGGSYIPVGAP